MELRGSGAKLVEAKVLRIDAVQFVRVPTKRSEARYRHPPAPLQS